MNSFIRIIETALPVLLALAIGMLCRKKQFLSRDGVDALKKVVVNITLPAVLVNAFATAQYDRATLAIPVIMFLLCCAGLGLGKLLARLLRLPGRLSPFLATGFEAGMLGYALFTLLYPHESTAQFAILDLGQVLFVFTLYKGLLSGRQGRKALVKDAVTSPVLWAILVGVLLGSMGLYGAMGRIGVSGILDSVTDFVSAPTGMIILLTVGYDLVPEEIPWKETFRFILLRLIVMAILLLVLLGLNRTVLHGVVHEGAAILMFLLPPPYVLPVFADEPSQRVQISAALSALTLVSLVLFALLSVGLAL